MKIEEFKQKYKKFILQFEEETGKKAIHNEKLTNYFKRWVESKKYCKQMEKREEEWRNIKIEKIYIKDIKIDDSLTFRDRWSNDEDDGVLLMSILDVGLINPIIIRPINNGEKYSLVEGYRRLTAMKKLGYEQIKCKIMELSNSEAMGVFVSTHLGRKGNTYGQITKQVSLLRGLIEDYKKEGLRSDNEIDKLNEFVNNIEKNNPKPPLITQSTQPYYCSRCKRKHFRGEIYKKHKGYMKE